MTSCQTTGIGKEWEGHGETTISTSFQLHIGGAMKRKDRRGWRRPIRSYEEKESYKLAEYRGHMCRWHR